MRINDGTTVQSNEETSTNGEAKTAIDVDTQLGYKHARSVEEEDPVVAYKARTVEILQKIKEQKTAAKARQSWIRFAAITVGTTPGTPPTKRADKAAARKSASARTQTMINQKEEYIQC